MVSVAEAAQRAGRDPETIRRWIRAGKVSAWKVGGQHMIDEEDLATAIRGVGSIQPGEVRMAREAGAPYFAAQDHRPATAIDPWLTTIVGRIVRAMDPTRIILFGARARGEARADSDYELLVILPEVPDRMAARVAVRRSFEDVPVPADIHVASVDEIDGQPSGALYWALKEGCSVYARAAAR